MKLTTYLQFLHLSPNSIPFPQTVQVWDIQYLVENLGRKESTLGWPIGIVVADKLVILLIEMHFADLYLRMFSPHTPRKMIFWTFSLLPDTMINLIYIIQVLG